MESKLDRGAEKLTTGELKEAQQRSAKMFKEIQRQKGQKRTGLKPAPTSFYAGLVYSRDKECIKTSK